MELTTHLLESAYAVLSDPTKRQAYDRSLREAALAAQSSSSLALVPLAPARPPSPSFRNHYSRPRQEVRFDSSSYRAQEPRVDPYALFESVCAQAEQMMKPQGFKCYASEEELREDHYRSRIGNAGSHQDMLAAMLPPDDPFRNIAREHDRLGASSRDPWGQPLAMFGKDPWGRKFEGEMLPASGGRGSRMTSSLREGEKFRNGDYNVRFHYSCAGARKLIWFRADSELGADGRARSGRIDQVEHEQRRNVLHLCALSPSQKPQPAYAVFQGNSRTLRSSSHDRRQPHSKPLPRPDPYADSYAYPRTTPQRATTSAYPQHHPALESSRSPYPASSRTRVPAIMPATPSRLESGMEYEQKAIMPGSSRDLVPRGDAGSLTRRSSSLRR